MATNINVPFSLDSGQNVVIPLDRYSGSLYTFQLTSSGSGTALVEGTTAKINQGETAAWQTLESADGTALTAVTDPVLFGIERIPLEAIRITAATATITGTLMQSWE